MIAGQVPLAADLGYDPEPCGERFEALLALSLASHSTPAAAIRPRVGTARFAARGESTSPKSGIGSSRRA